MFSQLFFQLLAFGSFLLLHAKHLPNYESVKYRLDDMILSEDQMNAIFGKATRRNALIEKKRLWPNKIIPVIMNETVFNEQERGLIWSVLDVFNSKSCVKFENASKVHQPKYFTYVTSDSGCFSDIGHDEVYNEISLEKPHCLRFGKIAHEFLHTLGFFHMHTAPGRDDFVTIMFDNVIPEKCFDFYSKAKFSSLLNTPYDYESVMHYGQRAFSRNDRLTIVAKDKSKQEAMGQRTHISEGDILRLNRLYECN